MVTFLILWAWEFVVLMISVAALHLIYRLKGSELGMASWMKEIALAVFCSALQGGTFWIVHRFRAGGWVYVALAVVLGYLCYRAAHIRTMEWMEPLNIAAVQRVISFAGLLLLSRCLPIS